MPANLAFVDAVTKGNNIDKPHGAILVSEDTDKYDPQPYQVWAWALSPENRWMIGYVDAGSAKKLRSLPSEMPISIRLEGLRQWQLEDKKRLYISYSILTPSKPERRKNGWLAEEET
ncbi:hypothetical protein [Pontibaca salina]|uniref:Uncharacterized protein n=1 Tax=Pontibaca salina TaxID=2795731 RepID=A0A934HHM5_9RHOB|nr:hypothetical protein [Pontibaca salina]MBI6628323.1 hypothetical protein [Pontibaca salina]